MSALKITTLASVAAAAFTLMAANTAPAEAKDARISYNCSASGPNEMAIAARYRARGTHLQFTTEMEALPASGIRAGSVMRVFINDRLVGSDVFAPSLGQLVADLNLDTEPNDPGEKPFPSNLTIRRGDNIRVTVNTTPVTRLGCTLR